MSAHCGALLRDDPRGQTCVLTGDYGVFEGRSKGHGACEANGRSPGRTACDSPPRWANAPTVRAVTVPRSQLLSLSCPRGRTMMPGMRMRSLASLMLALSVRVFTRSAIR